MTGQALPSPDTTDRDQVWQAIDAHRLSLAALPQLSGDGVADLTARLSTPAPSGLTAG